MIKITDLEKDVLQGIYASEYADGPTPAVWLFSIRSKVVKKAQLSGVISSLVKKGLVQADAADVDGQFDSRSIWVTTKGGAVARDLGIYKEGK